jgi:hypothetical protein
MGNGERLLSLLRGETLNLVSLGGDLLNLLSRRSSSRISLLPSPRRGENPPRRGGDRGLHPVSRRSSLIGDRERLRKGRGERLRGRVGRVEGMYESFGGGPPPPRFVSP